MKNRYHLSVILALYLAFIAASAQAAALRQP